MAFYIKEWADKSATLITREGHHLFTFKNVDSALIACGTWYGVTANHVIPHLRTPSPRPAPRPRGQTAA